MNAPGGQVITLSWLPDPSFLEGAGGQDTEQESRAPKVAPGLPGLALCRCATAVRTSA